MDVHLRDLRYFVAVAEEASFTHAAERLHVSQPGLSKQLRQLERSLGATLLLRDRRGVSLTAAGAALLPEARRLLGAWDAVAGVVETAGAQERSELRVGLQTGLGRGLYPAVARRFAALQPGWRVALRLRGWSDPSAGLRDHTTDAAFLWLPVPDGLEARVLLVEPRWVALSAGHRLAARAEIDFAELLDEPFVALPAPAGPLRDFWLAAAERGGRPARVAVEAATPDETFEAVAAGAGIHLLAAGNVPLYTHPDVVCRPVSGLSPCGLAIAWRRGDRRRPVRAFVRACAEVADDVGDADDAAGGSGL
jgi:DNA-binding transcriptional LysR family regulator